MGVRRDMPEEKNYFRPASEHEQARIEILQHVAALKTKIRPHDGQGSLVSSTCLQTHTRERQRRLYRINTIIVSSIENRNAEKKLLRLLLGCKLVQLLFI